MSQSNAWYNDGLRKAQIRDMSGAIASLRRSLQYNRANMDARNLLGLVYYGRGEVAEALVEWIISKNLNPKDNMADRLIHEVQNSAKKLDQINQAVKKYNQCLAYCEQDGEDLAIIQLKKVISMHPTFLKAYQLLALLYLHTEQYAKARQILKEARKLDTTSEITLRYMHELTMIRNQQRPKTKSREESVEYQVGNETIIQPTRRRYRPLSGKLAVGNIIAGSVIGAAIVWFLIVPSVDEAKVAKQNQQVVEYSNRINALEAQVSAQTKTLDEYRAQNSDKEAQAKSVAGTAESYENLMTVSSQYDSGTYSNATLADTLLKVNREALGQNGQLLYDQIASEIFPGACETKFANGMAALNVANYETAIDALGKVIKMEEQYENGNALLNLGIAYMRSQDLENAKTYFNRVAELFPGTEQASAAQDHLNSMQAEDAQGDKQETASKAEDADAQSAEQTEE